MAHHVFRFPNGYGASVLIPGPFPHDDGAEVAVIRFTGPGADDYGVTTGTPITGDVIRADAPEVAGILTRIASL